MKISTLFMLIIAIQLSLMMFNSSHHSDTALFGFVQNPTNWSNTTFILFLGGIAAGVALGAAFVGSFIFGKPDLLVFGTASVAFISWCVPIGSLWQVIYEETGLFGTTANGWIATMFTAPLAIIAVFTIVNWWRSNSEM